MSKAVAASSLRGQRLATLRSAGAGHEGVADRHLDAATALLIGGLRGYADGGVVGRGTFTMPSRAMMGPSNDAIPGILRVDHLTAVHEASNVVPVARAGVAADVELPAPDPGTTLLASCTAVRWSTRKTTLRGMVALRSLMPSAGVDEGDAGDRVVAGSHHRPARHRKGTAADNAAISMPSAGAVCEAMLMAALSAAVPLRCRAGR
jgi:hypothetical protein